MSWLELSVIGVAKKDQRNESTTAKEKNANDHQTDIEAQKTTTDASTDRDYQKADDITPLMST